MIVQGGIQEFTYLLLRSGAIFNNRYGSFRHDDMLGREYGTKFLSVGYDSSRERKRRPKKGLKQQGMPFLA